MFYKMALYFNKYNMDSIKQDTNKAYNTYKLHINISRKQLYESCQMLTHQVFLQSSPF